MNHFHTGGSIFESHGGGVGGKCFPSMVGPYEEGGFGIVGYGWTWNLMIAGDVGCYGHYVLLKMDYKNSIIGYNVTKYTHNGMVYSTHKEYKRRCAQVNTV